MLPFQVQPEVGVVLVHIATALITLLLGAGVVPSMPVLITLRGVLFSPVLYSVVTAMTSFLINVLSTCGACTSPVLMFKYVLLFASILGYMGGDNKGTSACLILIFWLLNKVWWENPAGFPANCTCTPLVFALFESFLKFFIVKFATFLDQIVKFATFSI